MFALAVMRLVEQGIIDLDEDVNHYLTSWKVPMNGKWQPRITLRQILNHTAGVTVHGFYGYNLKDELPDTIQILNGQYPANSEPIRVEGIPELAAAGLWTTPSDLARLGIALQLILKGHPSKILTKESIEEMLIPGADGPVGIGFFVDGADSDITFSHNGTNVGFESRLKFHKENGKGLVIMINFQERTLIEEIERASDHTYNWPDPILKQKSNITMDKLSAEVFNGKYESTANKIMTIKNESDLLFIIPEDQMPIELLKESNNKFFSTQVNIDVEFTFDNCGNISALNIDQNGQSICFKKQK